MVSGNVGINDEGLEIVAIPPSNTLEDTRAVENPHPYAPG